MERSFPALIEYAKECEDDNIHDNVEELIDILFEKVKKDRIIGFTYD